MLKNKKINFIQKIPGKSSSTAPSSSTIRIFQHTTSQTSTGNLGSTPALTYSYNANPITSSTRASRFIERDNGTSGLSANGKYIFNVIASDSVFPFFFFNYLNISVLTRKSVDSTYEKRKITTKRIITPTFIIKQHGQSTFLATTSNT